MTPIFKKLNFKGQPLIVVLETPESFVPELNAMSAFTKIEKSLGGTERLGFILCFCTKQEQVNAFVQKADKLLEEDGLLWIAYPKSTSKKYSCDFNRDTGWAILGNLDFEPVRQVSIDEDLSALRFRRVDYIKKMTRSFAITEKGKKRTGIE